MFKGFEKLKDVQYVYTPFDSSLCGVKLEANNKKQYLLTGQILSDGKVLIHLCNYIEPWDDLSLSQKKSLNQRYQMGCGCKVSDGQSLSPQKIPFIDHFGSEFQLKGRKYHLLIILRVSSS
uniref:Metalloproteinase inhibitor 4 n=1 Tax=Malurus cyaneus samueli TaxID=2593467 RepID=A0A8C5U1Q8_9PASS